MQEKNIRRFVRQILYESYIDGLSNDEFSFDMPVDNVSKKEMWNIRNALADRGFQMYIVGGAVRDSVKNAIKIQKNPMDTTIDVPKDFDLATDAKPDDIIDIFKTAPFIANILGIGEAFAIQFLVTKNGNEYELATFRKDIGSGRRPDSVEYVKNPEEDAKRRDLTINSLFFRIDELTENGFFGSVLDFTGGVDDIKNNVVKTVGDANERFGEDPLRKLRAIRFAAKMGSEIPKDVKDAIKKDGTSLRSFSGDIVSAERIRDEFFNGILSAKSTVNFLTLLSDLGFFKHIFENLSVNTNLFCEEKCPYILIANILQNNGIENIIKVLTRRSYSNIEKNFITFLIKLIDLNDESVVDIANDYKQRIHDRFIEVKKKKFVISKKEMYRFAQLNHIDKLKIDNMIKLATEFDQKSVSALLVSMGYQEGVDFGVAVKRIKQEFYKNPNKIKQLIEKKDKESLKSIILIQKNN